MPTNHFTNTKYITLQRLAQLTGYSSHAIYGKVKTGIWLQGQHWRKAPDGRLMFNLKEIERWIES